MLPLILVTVCVISRPANAETSIYVFDTDRSIVVKTGGFAGVHETYSVAGQFQLTVDSDAGIASFEIVDANLVDETSVEYGRNLDEAFNMTGLTGMIIDETTIEFEGKTADGTESDVRLKLNFSDDMARLTGNTTPPPNSADMFFYDVNAIAIKKYAGGAGEPNDPYQIATAEDLITLGETPEDYDMHFIVTADIDLDPNLPGRKVFDKAVIGAGAFVDTNPWTFIDIDPNAFVGIDPNIGAGTFISNERFEGTPFTGSFDGNGHTISHLTIIGESNLGLFGQLENGATISNLGLEAVNVNGTGFYVGGLVGENSGGIIVNCYSSGNINGSWYVGGLTGCNSPGTVAYCYSTGTVSGELWIGGLVGFNESGITNCYASNKVSGTIQFGGLVGYSEAMLSMDGITNSYFLISRDGGGPDNGFGFPLTEEKMAKPDSFFDWDFVGKLDGPHDIWAEPVEGGYPILWWQLSPLPELPFSNGKGETNNPYLISTADELNSIGHNPRLMPAHFKLINDIDLTGIDFFIIGSRIFPFSGVFDGNGHTISNFNHTIKYADVVGLFGYVQGPKAEIKDLGLINPNINQAIGDVGSLVGYFGDGTISNCYSDGGSVNGYYSVGGLMGTINGTITNCHSSTTVSGIRSDGGLVGSNTGLRGLFSDKAGMNEYTSTISNCYSTGSVSGDRTIGGLVGNNYFGHIKNCYTTAVVDGNMYVGGLVGSNGYTSTISNCYSTGSVSGDRATGGLVGNNYFGHLMNCYARAPVTGNRIVGGLVGLNYDGSIWSCYSTGSVIGTKIVGGLIGENTPIPNQQGQYNTGIIGSSFWDMDTSGQTTSDGGIGLTTTEMQMAGTFLEAGWDFVDETENGMDDIWWILKGQDYPRLWWEADD